MELIFRDGRYVLKFELCFQFFDDRVSCWVQEAPYIQCTAKTQLQAAEIMERQIVTAFQGILRIKNDRPEETWLD